jgi:type IV secretory pathway TraG/TraD family ATPase VirD4
MNGLSALITKIQYFSITIAIIGIALIVARYFFQRQSGKSHYLSTARLGRGHGIIFGKARTGAVEYYSPCNAEGSCFICGTSGTGKTSALLIPTLRSWEGTSLTIDISGDISSNVDCPNKLIYNPEDPHTLPYNIFAPIDSLTSTADQNEALTNLAYLLMPDTPNASANAKYFQDGGREMLIGSLIAFYHKNVDFCDICEQILGSNYHSLLGSIDQTRDTMAIYHINQFEGNSEQNSQGCKQNLDNSIMLFVTNERVRRSIRRPKSPEEPYFSPKTIEDHNVFVCIPDIKLKVYAPLLRIISAQSLDYFASRPNGATPTILFSLDEFHSLGKMEIGDALRKLRKKNVRIMVLTQSIADIDEVYGHDAHKAMIDNFPYKIILGVGGTETQKYFAEMIGMVDKKTTSTTKSRGNTSETVSYRKEYIVEPADLGRLDNDLILLYPGGHKRLRKNFYYQHKRK